MRLGSFIIGIVVLLFMRVEIIDTNPWDAVCCFFYCFIPVVLIITPLVLEFLEQWDKRRTKDE